MIKNFNFLNMKNNLMLKKKKNSYLSTFVKENCENKKSQIQEPNQKKLIKS